MAYRLVGRYVASCNCSLLCPCPVDGPPTGPNGECRGVLVCDVSEGNLENTDLGGATFALYNYFPSNITSGNWKVAIVVDGDASDAQAQAIERIVSGQEGGPFGQFVPLIGEYLGMERAAVGLSDGRGTIEGSGEFSFEPLTGPTGSPVTIQGAMFAFAPEYTVGKTSGHLTSKAGEFEAVYGETADFDWSSEAGGDQPHGRA
jgi:hypothetical protein